MELIGNLFEILKYAQGLGFGALFGMGLLGGVYFAFCLASNSLSRLDYLPVVCIIGASLGYGIQGILVVTNKRDDKLRDFQMKKQFFQETRNEVKESLDLGLLDSSQAKKITEQAFRGFLLSDSEAEATNISESRQQEQISQRQEE